MKTENALIESTLLGKDSGHITFWLHLKLGGEGQGFGGYSLRNVKVTSLIKLLDTVGVESWEGLKGTYVRVQSSQGRLTDIGHIVENKWFNLDVDLV